MQEILKKIDGVVKGNDVVLFMKGNAGMPMCGFSSGAVSILDNLSVKYSDVNVLSSEELRAAIKEFSNWPTIPQLYVKGEFIGGYDILKEMFEDGSLKELFVKHSLV